MTVYKKGENIKQSNYAAGQGKVDRELNIFLKIDNNSKNSNNVSSVGCSMN